MFDLLYLVYETRNIYMYTRILCLSDALNAHYLIDMDNEIVLPGISLTSRFISPFRPLSIVKLFRQRGPRQFTERS